LNFTADGTFESACIFRANGNHKHNYANNQTPVAIADLATSIITYITTNYAGATITSAEKDWNGGFEVHITTAAGVFVSVKTV
jgi:hypothetical protein